MLLSIIIIFLCVYLVLAWWHVSIVCSPPPKDGIHHHTKIDLEVNWRINQPPIMWNRPWLSFLVQNHLFFYWLASILGVIFVYLKSTSWSITLLSAVLFLIALFVLTKTIQIIVVAFAKKHW